MRQLWPGVLMVLAGCMAEPAGTAAPAGQAPDAVPHAFDTIRLTRTPCFGRCPVYSVTLHGDGRVEYHGERWVASEGEHSGQADAQELERLRAVLESRPPPLLADYRPGNPACGTVRTDMPGASITIQRAGQTHTLHYYEGCSNVPDWLVELAEQIDAAAATDAWVEGEQAPER